MEIFTKLPPTMYQHLVEDLEQKVLKVNKSLTKLDKINYFKIYHKYEFGKVIENWFVLELNSESFITWFALIEDDDFMTINDFLIYDTQNNYGYKNWKNTVCNINHNDKCIL